jgi:hypothetical protein
MVCVLPAPTLPQISQCASCLVRQSLATSQTSERRSCGASRELAARLIPKSDDPTWSDAAREIAADRHHRTEDSRIAARGHR